MLALSGYPLGLQFRFFDKTAGPASQVAECLTGEFEDEAALTSFAAGLDAITFEFENVPVASAAHLALTYPVFPPPRALAVSQHRSVEKRFLSGLGIPTAQYRDANSLDELLHAHEEFGPRLILKTARHGYDGRGQVPVSTREDAAKAWEALRGRELIAEQMVRFDRELSLVAVRSQQGDLAFYPLVENVHRDGILFTTAAPAPNVDDKLTGQARDFARRVLEDLNYVGVLAIELFQCGDQLLANEIAPRVHNSGHWSIDGAVTSQFENHIRAVCGKPLGSTEPRGYSRMLNLIGTVPSSTDVLRVRGSHLHLYGKDPRPGRKLGHVTVNAAAAADADEGLAELLRMVDR